jgi:amidase
VSAIDQAAAVRAGEVSARELVEESLARIERLNGELNAFVTMCGERALAEADAIEPGDERPLAGVPIAIKDIGVLTEGVRTTMGTVVSGDWVPSRDSALVAKLRRAGGLIVGKTSTPELGLVPVTEPARFGPTRNPWDPSRTPGGSSGGSAAAVAAGMVELAHGNDGGGSIRIPASCCGLVGLKPSRGRVSSAPVPDSPAGIVAEGVLTRTVADTALGLDIVAGNEPGDASLAPPPVTSFAVAAAREPSPLRIGFTTTPPVDADVDPETAAAVVRTAELLESLGHEVEEAAPRWEGEAFVEAFTSMWAAEAAVNLEVIALTGGAELDLAAVEPVTRYLVELARSASPLDAYRALGAGRVYSRRVVRWWRDHDVLVSPVTSEPAIPVGSLYGGDPAEDFRAALRFCPFTASFNVTGQPAVSLPLHQSAGGLPIGVQFAGPPAGEELLLSLAAQLEQAAPWAERRPALAAAY